MANQRPILAASAAVFRGGEVLLVRRGQALAQGLWSLPGGKVEFGETASAAALREVLEETGIAARLRVLVRLYDIILPDQHFAIACFAATWLAGEPVAASDAAEARFVALSELSLLNLAPNTTDAISAALRLAEI